MKIALIGYGKMGKAIEALALQRGHTISLRIGADNLSDFTRKNLQDTDVAIEFTHPSAAVPNLTKLAEWGIPTVCGTTGWLNELPKMEQLVKAHNSSLLYASNFSIGVNLFRRANKWLANLMSGFPEYKVSMEEVHHTQKLDHPSGTAITLAQEIIGIHPSVTNFKGVLEGESSFAEADQLLILSKREEQVPGIHSIIYKSPIDQIVITHEAFSREGFALGAVMAAEWLPAHKGCFPIDAMMDQLLQKQP